MRRSCRAYRDYYIFKFISSHDVRILLLKTILKIELGRYGIPIYDIPKFAKIWSGVAQKGYDIDKIILEFSDLEAARSDYMFYQERIPSLKMQKDEVEESTKFYKQRLSYVEDLQAIGFGLKELKELWYTIVEISNTNNISREDCCQEAFEGDRRSL